ncbi:MAG: hypothetical protein U0841_11710 [Chloroflexia bacterium]
MQDAIKFRHDGGANDAIDPLPELAEVIEELVKSGGYHDTEEVVAEAVFALRQQRQLEALHAAIAIGEQGFCAASELYTPNRRDSAERDEEGSGGAYA